MKAFTLSTTKDVVTTPAHLVGGPGAGIVACVPPVQNPDDTETAAWSATLQLLELGNEVKNVDVTGKVVDASVVWFGSEGTHLAGSVCVCVPTAFNAYTGSPHRITFPRASLA